MNRPSDEAARVSLSNDMRRDKEARLPKDVQGRCHLHALEPTAVNKPQHAAETVERLLAIYGGPG